MKVIITGSTGMVGKGILLECLESDRVESVLVVNRRPLGIAHKKLKEIIHSDFLDLNPIKEQLTGFDACFYSLGVSSVGMNEDDYTKFTYNLTAHWAEVLYQLNPEMVFNFVSGAGTDGSGQGKSMWARVKGKAENMVLCTGFKDAYAFRPGVIIPEKGIKSRTGWVNVLLILFWPFYPLMRKMKSVTTTSNIGKAMINSLIYPQETKHLENPDIDRIALK